MCPADIQASLPEQHGDDPGGGPAGPSDGEAIAGRAIAPGRPGWLAGWSQDGFSLSARGADSAAMEAAWRAAGLEVLRRLGLFDEAFYRETNRDLSPDADALQHYHDVGWREGRRPNFYFDPAWYLQSYADVRGQGLNPLLHYTSYGEREGRRPVLHFDPVWYRAAHDLPDDACCLLHFLELRHTGAVSPIPEFDAAWYLRTYPDVAAAGMDPMEHYLIQGYREARNPSPRFDTRFYKLRYLQAGGRSEGQVNPLLHFLAHRDQPGIHPSMPADETSIPREIRRNTAPGPHFEEFRRLPAGTTLAGRLLAFYLPQFHAMPENDAWWGQGFTEWTNVQRGTPRFAGHYQPRVPRDLGHYRLDDGTATLRRQIALARGAGVSGFVFYFYWFNGRRLLDRPLEAFLAERDIDFPFCLMWANENWTRRWDGSDDEVLISQDYREADEAALLACFARHFTDPRYIRLQGRPLLMVYRPGVIPDAAAAIARWREGFRAAHGEDPIFVMSQSFADHDPRAYGMDGAVEFPPHKLATGLPMINDRLHYLDYEFSAQVFDYAAVAANSLATQAVEFPLIKTIVPGWDNDARRQGAGLVVHDASPERYQAWLEQLVRLAQSRRFFGEAIVCVNAWNEWAEGAYLEPDQHFGAAYLNATGRAMAGLGQAAMRTGVLLVGHDAFPAGAQLLLLHLARRLVRGHGVRVAVLLLGGGTLQAEYAEVAPVTVTLDAEDFTAQAKALRDAGFGHAIVNSCAAAQTCGALRGLGLAPVLLVHEMPRLLIDRDLLGVAVAGAREAAETVFAAETVRERFVQLAGALPGDGRILPQGCYRDVAFSMNARARLRRLWRLAADDMLVVGVGYADLRKGFDLFLQVWRAARKRSRRVRLFWIGDMDPAMRSFLAAEIEAAEASGSFRCIGWRDDVGDILSAADALALTSREDPFPSVVLEAMAAGLPTVAFAGSGGIPEMLERLDAGAVAPLGDADAMARLLLTEGAARSPRQRVRLAATAREHFDFARYAEALLALARPGLVSISVVVPSYNYAQYLRARLSSIFAQTYPVAEIIVLDDASGDDSVAIARAAAEAWGRELRVVVNETNSGSVFRQWQKAAELARGDYLWIAEADDGCAPHFLERLAAALKEAPDALLAFSDSRTVDAEDRCLEESYRAYYAQGAGPGALAADEVFDAAGFSRRFLAERNMILNVSAVLWRRAALCRALTRIEADLDRWRMAGDWRLYSEVLTGEPGSVVYVAEALNTHRRHAGGVTASLDAMQHLREIARMHSHAARQESRPRSLRRRQQRYLREVASLFGGEGAGDAGG